MFHYTMRPHPPAGSGHRNQMHVLGSLTSVTDWFVAISGGRIGGTVTDDALHVRWAGEWLLKAQERGDGGYAHCYHLTKGWLRPYAEITGFTIPTLLHLSDALALGQFRDSAINAGEWLLVVQAPDGSFQDLRKDPRVFDTAQALRGYLSLFQLTHDSRYLDAAVRGARWMVACQATDGAWRRHAFQGRPHTFYAYASCVLAQWGQFLGDQTLLDAARRHVGWVMGQQLPNGYFQWMDFTGEVPFLHTIAYTLKGLLESYRVFQDASLLASVLRAIAQLLDAARRDQILRSQYDQEWRATNRERCLTGLAQWADVLLDVFQDTQDPQLLTSARQALTYLKGKQLMRGSANIRGALPNSIPLWGEYGPMGCANWNAKFFIDALLRSRSLLLGQAPRGLSRVR